MTEPEKNGLIQIKLGKGCYLPLTYVEYKRAIIRGKMEKRRIQMEKRMGQQ